MLNKKLGVIFAVFGFLALSQASSLDDLLEIENAEADMVLPEAELKDLTNLKATNHCDTIDCDEEELIAKKEALNNINGDSSEDESALLKEMELELNDKSSEKEDTIALLKKAGIEINRGGQEELDESYDLDDLEEESRISNLERIYQEYIDNDLAVDEEYFDLE